MSKRATRSAPSSVRKSSAISSSSSSTSATVQAQGSAGVREEKALLSRSTKRKSSIDRSSESDSKHIIATNTQRWSKEEDEAIRRWVKSQGEAKWTVLGASFTPARLGKQCRERWHNVLNPSISRKEWSDDEIRTLFEQHAALGNQWARIASALPGRTSNSVKNQYHLRRRRLEKQSIPVSADAAVSSLASPVSRKKPSKKAKKSPPSLTSATNSTTNDDEEDHDDVDDDDALLPLPRKKRSRRGVSSSSSSKTRRSPPPSSTAKAPLRDVMNTTPRSNGLRKATGMAPKRGSRDLATAAAHSNNGSSRCVSFDEEEIAAAKEKYCLPTFSVFPSYNHYGYSLYHQLPAPPMSTGDESVAGTETDDNDDDNDDYEQATGTGMDDLFLFSGVSPMTAAPPKHRSWNSPAKLLRRTRSKDKLLALWKASQDDD